MLAKSILEGNKAAGLMERNILFLALDIFCFSCFFMWFVFAFFINIKTVFSY